MCFEVLPSLKVNWEKNELITNIEVSNVDRSASLSRYKVQKLLITYLGDPFEFVLASYFIHDCFMKSLA